MNDYSLISQIAYEKLCSDGPQKALDFVLECIPGMPEDYAMQVVMGHAWVTHTDDPTMVNFTTTRPEGYFKTPDMKWLCTHRMDDMKETMKCIIDKYYELKGWTYIGEIDVTRCTVNDLKNAKKMLCQNPPMAAEEWYTDMWDKINDGFSLKSEKIIIYIVYIIKNTQYFIADCKKSNELWSWMARANIRPEKDVNFYRQCANIFKSIMETSVNDRTINKYFKDFKKDIESIIEGNEFMKLAYEKKAIPCDIMDGYDAGWISPEGIFYGADGGTSALLHLMLADELGMDDRKLDEEHWVKVHHQSAYSYPHWSKDENTLELIVNPDGSPWNGYVWSKPQFDAVAKYVEKFYDGVVNLEGAGWKPRKITDMKQMDIIALHECLI